MKSDPANIKEIIEKFEIELSDPSNTENQIQKFLEEHSELIPLPFLLNHHLHMGAIISKFPLGSVYITDFAYLTKSSDEWYVVFIEIEDPKKTIFLKNNEDVYFSQEFNHAYDQITSWQAYMRNHSDRILYQIDKFRQPLNENRVRFKYVLIFGRSDEKKNYEKKRAMFAEKNTEDIRVMTYDSLISTIRQEYCPSRFEKIILSPWKEQGFRIKDLPRGNISTALFVYMLPECLKVDSCFINRLKCEDYDMDSWLKGIPLELNEKYPRDRVKEILQCSFRKV